MAPALDALPGRPLTVDDVATLDESATLRAIPHTWYGEQVIAVLLATDERRAGASEQCGERLAHAGDENGERRAEAKAKGSERLADASDEDDEPGDSEHDDTDSTDGKPDTEPSGTGDGTGDDGQTAREDAVPGGVEIVDGRMSPGSAAEDETRRSDATPAGDDDSGGTAGDAGGGSRRSEDGVGFTAGEDGGVGVGGGDGFDTSDDAVGTVEVIGADGSAAPAEDDPTGPDGGMDSSPEGGNESSEDLHVIAAGYDDGRGEWVPIAEIDPDAPVTAAAPLVRDWLAETYPDDLVSRLAVGPAAFDGG